jgi:hypothetical protein
MLSPPSSGGKTKIYYQRLSAASPTQAARRCDAAIISLADPATIIITLDVCILSTCVDLCNKINDILMKKNLT